MIEAGSPGFSLSLAMAALAAGQPVVFRGVSYVHCRVHGEVVHFATDVQRDPIQRAHRAGRFYEAAELALIRQIFPPGGVFVDIGANVGNHGLYAARFLHASRVVPIEPNPRAFRLLLANVLANGLESRFDLAHLGYGAGATDSGGYAMEAREVNLGASRMLEGEGDIELRRGDTMLGDLMPDFIKIDVEGMEMQVLDGLAATLSRASPAMMVEVDVENEAAFQDWIVRNDYVIRRTLQHHPENRNHILRPRNRRNAGNADAHHGEDHSGVE